MIYLLVLLIPVLVATMLYYIGKSQDLEKELKQSKTDCDFYHDKWINNDKYYSDLKAEYSKLKSDVNDNLSKISNLLLIDFYQDKSNSNIKLPSGSFLLDKDIAVIQHLNSLVREVIVKKDFSNFSYGSVTSCSFKSELINLIRMDMTLYQDLKNISEKCLHFRVESQSRNNYKTFSYSISENCFKTIDKQYLIEQISYQLASAITEHYQGTLK